MNAIIRKVAKDYYLKRVPDAKPAVLESWMRAAVAVGAHESQLSHYRISQDGRYKLMTGDHLISHGVMQVNQEFHANQDLDSSFDLVGNIVGGLDTYFLEWNRAINEKCYVTSNGKGPSLGLMLSNRARSAYSAYNGGPSRLCRFSDSKSPYKAHDDQFLTMYRDQPWMKYVTDANRPSPVNTQCLIDGDDLCAMAKPRRDQYIKSRPILLTDGRTCVTGDGANFTCATDMRVFTCLAKIDPNILENDPLKLDKAPANAKITMVKDREPLCMKAVDGLFKVGTMIMLKKEILMRESVGGSPIGNTRAGRIYQVQDYELRLGGKSERYYKINTLGGEDGWIYGGENQDRDSWIQVATPQAVANAIKVAELVKAEKATAKAKAAAIPSPTPLQVTINAPARPTAIISTARAAADESTDDSVYSSEDDRPQPVLPVVGSVIEVVKTDGIVLRQIAGEPPELPSIDQLYKGARLTVEAVVNKGTENSLYLKVSQGGKTGWIYVGHTFPDVTVTTWIKIWK
jgi:hypothetical protein